MINVRHQVARWGGSPGRAGVRPFGESGDTMKKALLAGIASITFGMGVAGAADMPVKAPPYVPPPAFSWTGCYIGGNLGGKWEAHRDGSVTIPGVAGLPTSTFVFDDGSSNNNGSFVGGGQVGCNYQTGHFVFGIEGDFDWSHLTDSVTVGPVPPFNFVPGDSFSWNSRWQASLRGRVGYAWDRTLLYVTGGVAWTNVNFTANWLTSTCGSVAGLVAVCPGLVASDQQTLTGATVGGGLEYAITNNLIAGIEGRYTWYGSQTFNTGVLAVAPLPNGGFSTSPTSASLKLNTAEVLARLSWKFDWGGPVVARY
jgi:outer membrane immunogenic protein